LPKDQDDDSLNRRDMAIPRDGCLAYLVLKQLFDHGMLRGLPESTGGKHDGQQERGLLASDER
jgi:hypothetical protein